MPTPQGLSAVVRELSPSLKAAGWKRFGTTFNRVPEPGLVHVINVQGNRWGDTFTVNLGVYVREIDRYLGDWWGRGGTPGEPGSERVVFEHWCWLRRRLGRLSDPGGDTWWRYDHGTKVTTDDVRHRLEQLAFPVFAEVSEQASVLATYEGDRQLPQWMVSYGDLGLAILLHQAGRSSDAAAVVNAVITKAGASPLGQYAADVARRLGLAATTAPSV